MEEAGSFQRKLFAACVCLTLIVPRITGDIPDGVSHCSFAWERGSKLFVTEPVRVTTCGTVGFCTLG